MKPLIIACFCLVSTTVPAQISYAAAFIPAASLENAVCVTRRQSVHYQITDVANATSETVCAYTILQPKGDHFAVMTQLSNSYQSIKMLRGRVFDANGQLVRESKKEDIKTYGDFAYAEYTDDQASQLDMRYSQYPYTVEFTVRISYHDFFLPVPFELQYLGQSVENASLEIDAPAGYLLHWKGVNTAVEPQYGTAKNRDQWRWAFSQIAAPKLEEHTGLFEGLFAFVVLSPEQISIDARAGNFKDWNQTGRFFYDLNSGGAGLSDDMVARVKAMTARAATTTEKTAILYRFLQKNYRYVSIQIGIGGWKSFDPAFVEQKKYGDCKALSNYMKALLQAAGIDACQAIVYGDPEGAPPVFEDLPFCWFNHAILYVPETEMWLDCTSTEDPAGYLGSFTADRAAMLLTPEGGKLVHTPAPDTSLNTERASSRIVLKENGNATVASTVVLTGFRQEKFRYLASERQPDKKQRQFLEAIGLSALRIDQMAITADSVKPEVRTAYAMEILNFANRSGKRFFVPLTKSRPFSGSLPVSENRQNPLALPDTYTLEDTLEIEFPAGFALENVAKDQSIRSEFGAYSLQVIQNPHSVQVLRKVVIYPVHVPAERYNAVRDFYGALAKADAAKLVLIREE